MEAERRKLEDALTANLTPDELRARAQSLAASALYAPSKRAAALYEAARRLHEQANEREKGD